MIESTGRWGARLARAQLGLYIRWLVSSLYRVVIIEVWVNEIVHLFDFVLLRFLIIVHRQVVHHPIPLICRNVKVSILFLFLFGRNIASFVITNWGSRSQWLRIIRALLDSLIIGVTSLELSYVAVVWKSFAHQVRLRISCAVNIILSTLLIFWVFLATQVITLSHLRALSRGFLEVVSCILRFIQDWAFIWRKVIDLLLRIHAS